MMSDRSWPPFLPPLSCRHVCFFKSSCMSVWLSFWFKSEYLVWSVRKLKYENWLKNLEWKETQWHKQVDILEIYIIVFQSKPEHTDYLVWSLWMILYSIAWDMKYDITILIYMLPFTDLKELNAFSTTFFVIYIQFLKDAKETLLYWAYIYVNTIDYYR